jgi:molybdate transport system ATP-binding protein
MSLAARVITSLGTLELDVAIAAEPGAVVAIVGPNGAGKTTLLRALAGLLPLRAGQVELQGRVLEDVASGINVPPEQRPVAMMFQEGMLFPHMTARDNVAFGLRARGIARRDARERAEQWLIEVGMREHASARPSQLSAGQRQRVALARALVTDPRLLLLDEPLAAVDVSARVDLRRTLREQLSRHHGIRLLVTHDPLEAMALASRLVVVEGGRVTQEGSMSDVAARPRSSWVAAMLGVNLYRGDAVEGGVQVTPDVAIAAVTEVRGLAFAVVHPRAVQLHRNRPEGSARNVWAGRTESLDHEGDRVRVRVRGELPVVAEVTPAAVKELGLATGDEVWVSLKATEVQVYAQ